MDKHLGHHPPHIKSFCGCKQKIFQMAKKNYHSSSQFLVHHTMILIGSRQTDAVYPTEGISLLAAVNGGLIRLSFAFRGVEMNVADTQNLIGPPELHREQI